LRAARARGLTLLFVTARPPRRTRLIPEAVELSKLAICGNGSVLYDLKTDTLLHQERLCSEHASLIVESLRTAVPDVAFAIEIGLGYGCDANYSIMPAYCGARGISSREVVAFGDMPNDLPMLRWAGCGIAVANAHPAVLAAADYVTRSNDADGVALALRQFGYA
jgi:hydroxymethylpyrimidine pyrophosphatase-like HAD family hydrolase